MNIKVIYTLPKSALDGLQFRRYNTGLSAFVQLLLVLQSTKSREIPREFELIAVQGRPRSSILATSY